MFPAMQPGYGAFMIDFHISKNMIQSTEEKIVSICYLNEIFKLF